jgi:Ca2+:H+ antiporter
MRGIPRNSEALGSPHRYLDSGGSSVARPGYGRTQTSTAYPVSYPVNPSHSGHGYHSSTMGTISRSASRARMPLKDAMAPPRQEDHEDDEAEVVDRGADLIKRRQRERKQARKKKEQERRKAEGGATPAITPGITPGITPNPSAPTSGVPGESFGGQQDRIAISRSGSRSRTASSAHQDGSESYFSSSWSSSVTPHGPPSPRDELHPPSIYSSAADDDDEEEEDARTSIINEVIHDVVEEAEEDEEDDDEEDNGGDDEGVTLKDRQDVSSPAQVQADSRQSISNILSVYPSGNRHCTARHEQSLGMPSRHSMLSLPLLLNGIFCQAISFGHYSLVGGSQSPALWSLF